MGVVDTCIWKPLHAQIDIILKRQLPQNTVKDFCNCMFSIGTLHQVKTLETYSGITQQAFGLLNKITQKCFADLCSSFETFMLKQLNV